MASGVTTSTVKNMILDAGVVYLNYSDTANKKILGATRGGATFNVEREIREIEVDGLKGKTKGFRRIVSENANVTIPLVEVTADTITKALAGASKSAVAGPPAYDKIESDATIVDADYITDITIVATVSGSTNPVVLSVKNALGDGNVSFKTTDKDEAVVEVTFSAHWDPADLTKAPWSIEFPTIS